ncbi:MULTISPECIES: NUDIX domain-containing protein [unclassified Brevibacterium]|uniref:NUDIX domain-containing protein n=1 Tax=unclassified Brevibacterium TaxID=2614124 RepID=UPI0010924793|nr:NUDIX hydrolase [Brevibacterium sp. S22]TGD28223.1 NUDIX hydrolase [Brevibacterium sp. S22]
MSTPQEPILQDEPFTPTITASDIVYRGAVWDIRKETFDLPEASGLVRDLMDHTGAVGIAVVDDQQRMLLVQQYRHPVGARLWEVPAGLLDVPGEPLLEAARRELREEADLTAGDWQVLSDSCLSPGGSSETMRLYLARDLTVVPEAQRHERSEEEAGFRFRWVSLGEALTAVSEGRVTNVIAQMAILQTARVLDAEASGTPVRLRETDAPRRLVDGRPDFGRSVTVESTED